MHILLTNVHLDCRGEGSSNRNASMDESVETGDESVETGDESIEAGEKHNNHIIIVHKQLYSTKTNEWDNYSMPQFKLNHISERSPKGRRLEFCRLLSSLWTSFLSRCSNCNRSWFSGSPTWKLDFCFRHYYAVYDACK